jgi:hypothetical protein
MGQQFFQVHGGIHATESTSKNDYLRLSVGTHITSSCLSEALTLLIAGMTATRTHLLEWVHTLGVDALQAVCTAEAEALASPKGKHQPERTHHHWGRTATELTFGGRRIQVASPRVRSRAGQVTVREDERRGAELHPFRHRGDEGQGRQRLEERIGRRDRESARPARAVRRLRLEGQGDVIGHEDRLEAARFRLARNQNQVLARGEAAVAGQVPAEVHGGGRAYTIGRMSRAKVSKVRTMWARSR